jgi:hypothetical protein
VCLPQSWGDLSKFKQFTDSNVSLVGAGTTAATRTLLSVTVLVSNSLPTPPYPAPQAYTTLALRHGRPERIAPYRHGGRMIAHDSTLQSVSGPTGRCTCRYQSAAQCISCVDKLEHFRFRSYSPVIQCISSAAPGLDASHLTVFALNLAGFGLASPSQRIWRFQFKHQTAASPDRRST